MTQAEQVIDWQKERHEATAARRLDSRQRATVDFRRTAIELAGNDQTMYRVLLARLEDAYRRGQDDRADWDRFYDFGWLRLS